MKRCQNCKRNEEDHQEDGKCIYRCRCSRSDDWVWTPMLPDPVADMTLDEMIDFYLEQGRSGKPLIGLILGKFPQYRSQAKYIVKRVMK